MCYKWVMGSIFGPLRPSDERAGLIWGSKISQNPQPPGRPKKLFERVLGRGKRRGMGFFVFWPGIGSLEDCPQGRPQFRKQDVLGQGLHV